MIKTLSLVFAIFLLLRSLPAMAQQGVYYYPGDTSIYPVPKPLTEQEISDPDFWARQKAAVQRQDANGLNLWGRGRYCEKREDEINRYAEIAMEWVFDHDLWTSPTRGFIPHGIAISDQQVIRTYAEVAFRDMRYAKNNGADTSKCDDIARFAISRILGHMERYPADEE